MKKSLLIMIALMLIGSVAYGQGQVGAERFGVPIDISSGTIDDLTSNDITTKYLTVTATGLYQGLQTNTSSQHILGQTLLLDDVLVAQDLIHYGNPLTKIRFGDDRIIIRVGNLSLIDGVEGATDYIYLGDGDWDYMIFGDTATKVYLSTFTYSNGNWDFPADVNVKGVITSSRSYACVHIATNTATTVTAGVWRAIVGNWTLDDSSNFTVNGTTITYIGATTKQFMIVVCISVRCDTVNTNCDWTFYKDGAVDLEYEQTRRLAVTGDIGSISLTGLFPFAQDDILALWIRADKNAVITQENTVISIMEAN